MSNVNPREIAKFNAQDDWWDDYGSYRPLHLLNPVRLGFIESQVSLKQKKIIDIGCGGGILTEALYKAGALCTGLDLGETTLQIAKDHALSQNFAIDYQLVSAETFAEQQAGQFDVVVCYELLEHVPDPGAIIKACSQLVKPDGWVFLSTLNRTAKAYLQAILGAEYVLNLLPKGTHDYQAFIKPSELLKVARAEQLSLKKLSGITYHLSSQQFSLSDKVDVNYLVALKKN